MKKHPPRTVDTLVHEVAGAMRAGGLFYGHGTDSAESEAAWLVTAVMARDSNAEIMPETQVSTAQQASIAAHLERRLRERLPLAYLLQEAWFAGYCFYVDERVLVPRSPVGELINNGFEPLLDLPPANILDLCCGSGCIGIASALAFPESRVVLSDLSAPALEVAEINIQRFGLSDRVSTCRSDLFAGIRGKFDLILSNPPYVPEREYRDLPAEYHREPKLGLVSEAAGLDIPLQILADAGHYLEEKGVLILETGHTWQALDQALPELPFLWLDFEHGGEGVCALSAKQLRSHFLSKSA